MILSDFFSVVSMVYSVHSLYLIREDIIVRKDTEKHRAVYIKCRKAFEILCSMRRTCNHVSQIRYRRGNNNREVLR